MTDQFDPSEDLLENVNASDQAAVDRLQQEEAETEDMLLTASALGAEALDFANSALGREMIRRAKQEVQDLALELLQVPAHEADRIREIQTHAGAAAMFMVMLNDITTTGDQAYKTLLANSQP